MITIRLLLDYCEGPIWPNISNPYTFEKSTGIKFIDEDKIIKEISIKMRNLYDNYYEFETHDVACWFDNEKFLKEKNIMLALLEQLKLRLEELNDVSYIIVDEITPMYEI